MSYDVQITIFGKVSNPEAIWDLALAAAAEGTTDWMTTFDQRRFLEMLDEAAKEGAPIVLTRKEATDLFDGVTSACAEAGMSYVVKFGETGADGFSEGFSWKPGMREGENFLLDGGDPVLRVEDVRKSAGQGIEAVTALVDRMLECTRTGKIEMDPGFMDEIGEYVDVRPRAI